MKFTTSQILAAIHADLPRFTARYSFVPMEERTLLARTEIRVFVSLMKEQDLLRGSLKSFVRKALILEARRLLMKRRMQTQGAQQPRAARSTDVACAKWVIKLVETGLPKGGAGDFVLKVVTGKKVLYSPQEGLFQRGISALSKAALERLYVIYGAEASSEFISALRIIGDTSRGAVPPTGEALISPLTASGGKIDAAELERRMDDLPYTARMIARMFAARASCEQIIETLARRFQEESGAAGELTDRHWKAANVEFVRALRDIRRAFGE